MKRVFCNKKLIFFCSTFLELAFRTNETNIIVLYNEFVNNIQQTAAVFTD